MIRSFNFDGQSILLEPSPFIGMGGERLFFADSMTLLVGPNGAGKTRALSALASVVLKENPSINDLGSVDWDTKEEYIETCAVYYTPVPFDIDVPRDGARFRRIQASSRESVKKISIKQREVSKELELMFGLDLRKILTLLAFPRSAIVFLKYRILGSRYGVTDSWVAPFRERNAQHEKNLREAGQLYGYGSPEMKMVRDAYEKLLSDFAAELQNHLGAEFYLRVRAYQYAQQGRKPSDAAQMQLLEGLGLSLVPAAKKRVTVARTRFDAALEKFRAVAEILDDRILSKGTYSVSDIQAERLHSLSLGGLGQVSLTGLSSGAAALIHQFTSIKLACEQLQNQANNRRLLLLIDEGDAFLHLSWQQQYIEYLNETVRGIRNYFKSVQVVIASHSPVLMSDFPRECIFLLNSRDWIEDALGGGTSHVPRASFGAPLDMVVRHVGQAGTLGKFAARVIKKLLQDIEAGLEVDAYRVDMIDDPIIKRQMINLLGSGYKN